MARQLHLKLERFENPARWRWLLQSPGGALVVDHQVQLDSRCWQFEAFADLGRYLRRYAAPDRMANEAEILAEVGHWIGEQVLGPVAEALVTHAPVAVRVMVPTSAGEVAFRPLELAAVAGRPLALRRVGLVWQIGDGGPRTAAGEKEPVTSTLRVLGLFSLPDGISALNLRRERRALADLMEDIGAVHHRAIEWRVLQYGVTRDRLRHVAEEGESWDIVHISGHGVEAGLLLEGEDGTPDLVSSAELADLLEPTAGRVKLVTVSSCSSAARLAAAHLRMLGLVPEGRRPRDEADHSAGDFMRSTQVSALATELASRLDTAVLGMRFPVADDFAVALSAELYELLVGKEQPLPQALGLALPKVIAEPATLACPPLSAATPAMFGESALDLILRAPPGPPVRFDAGQARKLAGVRAQPERFVGRVSLLAEASKVLAPRSGSSGVLFHGMPGAGKTACAAELTHMHLDSFKAIVWHEAPAEGAAVTAALTAFAVDLETKLPDLRLVHLLDDAGQLARFLPALTAFCERERLLIVLDNVESLLTEDGSWRDPRWEMVVAALTSNRGLSRLIVTSRRNIADLDPRIRVMHVHALSATEAMLLARELPHLRALIDATAPGVDADAGRRWVAQALTLSQGHPELLRLADGQAADPARLRERLSEAGQAWRQRGGIPDGFFTTGESEATAEDYLRVLDVWARGTAGDLPIAPATMFAFLCALEDDDRVPAVIGSTWGLVWRRNRPGSPPDPHEALAVLTRNALVAAERDPGGGISRYRIHPAVAVTGRALAGDGFHNAVDEELAAYWVTRALAPAQRQVGRAAQDMLLSRRGAAPYLLRLGEWETVGALLTDLVSHDVSRTTAASLLPSLQLIAANATGSSYGLAAGYLYARVLEKFDLPAASGLLRQLRSSACAPGNELYYFMLTATLIRLCIVTGQLDEALAVADSQIDHADRVSAGPWAQLMCQAEKLNVLYAKGQAERVFPEVRELLARAGRLPRQGSFPDYESPVQTVEYLYHLGRNTAVALSRWKDALDMSAALLESVRERGAHESFMARIRYIDYAPLTYLGRADEALEVLAYCRDVGERDHDVDMLGPVFAALADVEVGRGHRDRAIDLQRNALRYAYLARNVEGIAAGHHNLGTVLGRDGDGQQSLAHHVAAALIGQITGYRTLDRSLASIASGLMAITDVTDIPATPDELCGTVNDLDGVRLDDLLTDLAPNPFSRQAALGQVLDEALARAREGIFSGAAGDAYMAGRIARWDPVIAGILAARAGNEPAAAALGEFFAATSISPTWSTLGDLMHRISDRADDLTATKELDPIDIAITLRALGALAGRIPVPAELWPFMLVGELLGMLIEAISSGKEATARQCAEGLAAVAEKSGVAGLAGPLQSAVSGSRDAELARELDPAGRAIITTILTHLTPRRPGRVKDGTSLSDRISALGDQKAISALVLMLGTEGQHIDPPALQEAEPRLIEALQQPALRQLIEPDLAATPGALARTALEHLSARDEATRNRIWLALAIAGQ